MEPKDPHAGAGKAHADHGHRQRDAGFFFRWWPLPRFGKGDRHTRCGCSTKARILSILAENPPVPAPRFPRPLQPRKFEPESKPLTSRAPKIAVSAEEELRRVLPVITGLKKAAAGCGHLNRYLQGQRGPGSGCSRCRNCERRERPALGSQMAKTVAELKCGVVLMHMRGRPEEWRTLPPSGRHCPAGETGAPRLDGNGRAGGSPPGKSLSIRLRFRKKFRAELPSIGPLSGLQSLGLPLLAGTPENHLLAAWWQQTEKMRRPGPALWKSRRTDCPDHERRAHCPDARREGVVDAARAADAILKLTETASKESYVRSDQTR